MARKEYASWHGRGLSLGATDMAASGSMIPKQGPCVRLLGQVGHRLLGAHDRKKRRCIARAYRRHDALNGEHRTLIPSIGQGLRPSTKSLSPRRFHPNHSVDHGESGVRHPAEASKFCFRFPQSGLANLWVRRSARLP